IQQTSDTTYRLHDWDRVDPKTGGPRDLHVAESLACIDFSRGPVRPVEPLAESLLPVRRERLVACPYFRLWRMRGERPFPVGDAGTALATLRLAAKHGVRVGAHPSFPDREQFGRREMERTDDEILSDCVYQIGALAALARLEGLELGHVKPHGALYNMAMRD